VMKIAGSVAALDELLSVLAWQIEVIRIITNINHI
jgi:hypothetical protein